MRSKRDPRKVANSAEALLLDTWFMQLPAELSGRLLAAASPRRLARGQVICLRTQRHTGLYCLVEGIAHVSNHVHGDKSSFLASCEAPMWFGELGVFDDGPSSHDVHAHGPCTLLFFSREKLQEIAEAAPAFWCHLGKLQAMKLRFAYFLLDELSGMPTETRRARRLLAHAAGFGMRAGFSPTVAVRQELLAHSLGLVRASITPILQEWRRRGIVTLQYGGVVLEDAQALMSIARYEEWPDYYKKLFELPKVTIPSHLDVVQTAN